MRKLNKKQKEQIAVTGAKKDEDIDLTDMLQGRNRQVLPAAEETRHHSPGHRRH